MRTDSGLFILPGRNRNLAIIFSLFLLFAIPVTIIATLDSKSLVSKAASCLDLNGDGIANQEDRFFLQQEISKGSFVAKNDLNTDGKVNGEDLEFIKTHYGETCYPQVSFFVDPNSTRLGQNVTLTWSVDHASSVVIDEIGQVGKEGKKIIVATETKKYRLTATGPGGSVTAETTLQINP